VISLTFLNSGILFLLSAIILPILIYLFARKKPKKIIFSTIKFIKESQKKQNKKINLKNLLLLLIRIMIILLVILAISRPAIKSPFMKAGKKHPKMAAAILLDNSYSMDYLSDTSNNLEKAKDIAAKISNLLTKDDISMIYTLDGNWNEINSFIRVGEIPERIIRNVEITSESLPLEDVLKQIENKLNESQLANREIYYITDLQEQQLPQLKETPLFIIQAAEDVERNNISCQNSRLVSELVKRRLQKKIEFEIVNHSNQPQEDILCKLFIDGKTVAERVTALAPQQRKTEQFDIEIDKTGWHQGFVSVKNERLEFDNKNHFSFYYNLSPKIAVVSARTNMAAPLASVLEVFTGQKNNVKLFSYSEANYEQLKNFESSVILCSDELETKTEFFIEKLISDGKGLVFFGEPDMGNSWKKYLGKRFGLEYNNYYNKSEKRQITNFNKFHPLTKLLTQETVSRILLTGFWQSTLKAQGDALLQIENNPLILFENNLYLWNFSTNTLNNELFVNSAFPVLAFRCLEATSEKGFNLPVLKAGSSFSTEGYELILPDGNRIKAVKNPYIASQNGNYQLMVNDLISKIITVNLDYHESEFSLMTQESKDFLFFTGTNWENSIMRSSYGYEIWKILLLIALILFAIEMFLIKSEERKG